MSFILLEGLDRSGKSSLAEHYKKQGYKIVHMSAPDKKYFDPSYSGESYFEEMVRMYSKYDGQNVVFDRTIYGELIWSQVYNRPAQLSVEDIEYLAQIESNNNAERILMFDQNTEAHWQRCVDNNEPLSRQQFGRASIFYDRLAREYGFKKKQLIDFSEILSKEELAKIQSTQSNTQKTNESVRRNDGDVNSPSTSEGVPGMGARQSSDKPTAVVQQQTVPSLDSRLELANTIRDVLQSKILRKKGGAYDDLEKDIKDFLTKKLEEVFVGREVEKSFSEDEIVILKLYAKRIKEKM